MKIAFDTSVLIAATLAPHRDHARAVVWLTAVSEGKIDGVVSVHGLSELWSVLTKLPVNPPIPPTTARQVIEDVLAQFETVPVTVRDLRRDPRSLHIQGTPLRGHLRCASFGDCRVNRGDSASYLQ